MKIVTYNSNTGPAAGVAIDQDEIVNIAVLAEVSANPEDNYTAVRDILGGEEQSLRNIQDALENIASHMSELKERGAIVSFNDADLLPPIPDPKLILSIGLNYWKHLEEMAGTPVPKHPTAFIKAQDTLLGSGKPIIAPPQCSEMIDYEGELCVVIGKQCHNIEVDDAMEYVAGYTIANDVSARDWVSDVFSSEGIFPSIHAWERNLNGKQLPGFTPCGPVFVTKDEISDPHDLYMETRLNGEVMQSTKTDDMIFKISEVIAYYSKWYRFNPGDIITTGSPAGVGFGRTPKIFMKPGDVVEVEVEGIGTLVNSIS